VTGFAAPMNEKRRSGSCRGGVGRLGGGVAQRDALLYPVVNFMLKISVSLDADPNTSRKPARALKLATVGIFERDSQSL
jgi:hypothetical protein